MENKVNVAVQVLPEGSKQEAYHVVDKVIAFIESTGLKYRVCPFETVLEGDFDEILSVVRRIPGVCYLNGSKNVIINLKIQISNETDVTIEDKMKNYEK